MKVDENNARAGNQNLPVEGPFTIFIDVFADYINYMEYVEEYDEEEETPKITKSYKTEQCLICLNDEPNILCYDCLHICICLKCEELKPLATCPDCRAPVLEKDCI